MSTDPVQLIRTSTNVLDVRLSSAKECNCSIKYQASICQTVMIYVSNKSGEHSRCSTEGWALPAVHPQSVVAPAPGQTWTSCWLSAASWSRGLWQVRGSSLLPFPLPLPPSSSPSLLLPLPPSSSPDCFLNISLLCRASQYRGGNWNQYRIWIDGFTGCSNQKCSRYKIQEK